MFLNDYYHLIWVKSQYLKYSYLFTYFEDDKKYVFENIHKLVIKDVAETWVVMGVMFGHYWQRIQLEDLKTMWSKSRRFIAQKIGWILWWKMLFK